MRDYYKNCPHCNYKNRHEPWQDESDDSDLPSAMDFYCEKCGHDYALSDEDDM